MKRFMFFTNLFPLRYLNIITAENIQTILPASISNGQCTQAITLHRFISITQGIKLQNIFLYPVRNKAVKKATDTLA
jgi:hypothetical protein